MNIVYVDAETRYDIGAKTPDGSIGTFKDPARLGLTVACTQLGSDQVRDWMAEDLVELRAYLAGCDLIVGFNTIRFDLNLIAGVGEGGQRWLDCISGRLVDIFLDVQDAVGRVKGTGLKPIAKYTLGHEPDEDVEGKYAPELWRLGRRMEVIRYCRDDVKITRGLFYHGFDEPLKFVDERKGVMRQAKCVWKLRDRKGLMTRTIDQTLTGVRSCA